MQSSNFRPFGFPPVIIESEAGSRPDPLRQLLHQGVRYPVGSLQRQRIFSQLMLQMQASGRIWSGDGVNPDRYAEVLAIGWTHLCGSPESYLTHPASLVEQFNQSLREHL